MESGSSSTSSLVDSGAGGDENVNDNLRNAVRDILKKDLKIYRNISSPGRSISQTGRVQANVKRGKISIDMVPSIKCVRTPEFGTL